MSHETLRLSLRFARHLLALQGVRRPSADQIVRHTFPDEEREIWEGLDPEERDAISESYDAPTEEIDREAALAMIRGVDAEDGLQ